MTRATWALLSTAAQELGREDEAAHHAAAAMTALAANPDPAGLERAFVLGRLGLADPERALDWWRCSAQA